MPRRSKNAAVTAVESRIENHVAARIRLRRGLLGMSQSDLAKTLGITFQQVQKYERGSNRVSVGKLYRLAEILDVPLSFFFDGLDAPGTGPRLEGAVGEEESSAHLSRRELDLLRTWRQSPEPISDAVSALLRALNPGATPEEFAAAMAAATSAQPSATPHTAAAVAAVGPRRRGRPPKPKTAAEAESAAAGSRRKRNAVWDPSDIFRASKSKV